MQHYVIKRWSWAGLVATLVLTGGIIIGGGSGRADAPDTTPETSEADSPPVTPSAEAAPAQNFTQGMLFPYSLLDAALSGRIDQSGNVDYAALKGNKHLELFLQAVATADLSQFPVIDMRSTEEDPRTGRKIEKVTQDRSAELTFLINAYNAYVIKTLADAFPISSPDDIKDLHTAKTRRIGGKDWSLAELRADIAKREPRAAFALTDGTRSGPMLAPRAYKYSILNDLLEEAVKAFVNDPRNVELLRLEDRVTLNAFFSEVNPLFQPAGNPNKFQGIKRLLAAYTRRGAEQRYFGSNDFKVVFMRPDRSLNKNESQGPITGPGITGR